MNVAKKCPKCSIVYNNVEKYFFHNRSNPDGFNGWCKKCFLSYTKKHPEFSRKYRENNIDKIRKRGREFCYTAMGIYKRMKQHCREKKHIIDICSREEFIQWFNIQEKKCIYCDIPQQLLNTVDWGRKDCRHTMSIDRMDNNKGYSIDNICISCDVCNIAKNRTMSLKEMKLVGKSINKIWNDRLKSLKS